MEALRQLPAPSIGSSPSTAPILPPAAARRAPAFERREVEVTLPRTTPTNRRRMKTYLFGVAVFAVAAVGGWFGFSEYIYG